MTIYVSGRQSGKTTFLIRQSADTGAVIVAPTCQMARYIDSMARDLGLQIPPPVTVADWIRGLVRQPKDHDKTYLVDELQMALHQLNVKAATIDRNYEDVSYTHLIMASKVRSGAFVMGRRIRLIKPGSLIQ